MIIPGLRTYKVNEWARRPLIDFILDSLADAGCKILHASRPDMAPFVVTFETPTMERIGIVAYAFLATRTPTKNRPPDERSFQLKYGGKDSYGGENLHELWQDPLGMFTTLLVGIDPQDGFCVAADPILHSPTKFFIRMEFKDEHAEEIKSKGWHMWQRTKRSIRADGPLFETLAGATKAHFLDLVRFERAGRGLDPGDRLLLGERYISQLPTSQPPVLINTAVEKDIHPLAKQFDLSPDEIMDLISGASRLKMAVRGWVAEEHLRATLSVTDGITHCERLDEEGGPDILIRFHDGPPLTLECKNVARQTDKFGYPKIDFQRTRASKGDPCSRYYQPSDFDIVAACLHSISSNWDFKYIPSADLPAHSSCYGRINYNVRVNDSWSSQAASVFTRAYAAKGVIV
ncbi:hypothetical protein HFN87_03230 [Rhizobium laguerreae]|uniref:hypothetical protein n=1 Tax=Rhizobium laguerreae TaxID=1076926 RepID=UPI001C922EC8|nr:hypothetical protein [Rhizobium laguerreae]MBY3412322.1 hypothetical protein [Rhizobium laguerreae]